MIYAEPVIHRMGDCYLAVEFGDEADLALNFRVLALADALKGRDLGGIWEIVPTMRTLGIVFDAFRLRPEVLVDSVRELVADSLTVSRLPSRLVKLPVWYDDPWSRQLAEQHGVRNNLELVAELNGLSVQEAIAHHTGTEHWVACLGAQPGVYFAFALDRSKALTAPKWSTPRTFTPGRLVGLGGICTSSYPNDSPGGYQVVGRLAVNIYEPQQRNRIFATNPVLSRACDRQRYISVDEYTYGEIWSQCAAGQYEYEIENDWFDVVDYLAHRSPPARPAPEASPSKSASA